MTDDDALTEGMRGVLDAADTLITRLELTEVEVPPTLRRIAGSVRDSPITMTVRRFVGGAFAALTVATIVDLDGRPRAVTLIGTPSDDSLAPILGVDLVALGGSLSLVAVDLAPIDDEAWRAGEPLLDQLHRATEGRIVARRWPDFAAEVFSARALLAGVHRGHTSAVLREVAGFVVALAPIYAPAPAAEQARRDAARHRSRRWRLAERRNRREHDALSRIFGETSAAALVELLFPA